MDENLLIWAGIAIGAYLLYQSAQSSTTASTAASTATWSTAAPAPTYTAQQQAFLASLASYGVTLSPAQVAQMVSGASLNTVMTAGQLAQLQAHGLDLPVPLAIPNPGVVQSATYPANPTPASSASVGTPPVAPVGVSGIYPWERYS